MNSSSLIYTPSGLVVDDLTHPNLFKDGDFIDWLLDAMTFSLGGLSDDSSIQKAQVINQLAVNAVDDGFESIDCYFDAIAECAEVDPYAFLAL